MASDGRTAGTGDKSELATAIGLYILGEISLGKAAERVGLSRWEMEEILRNADVELRLGARSRDELHDEVETALDIE